MTQVKIENCIYLGEKNQTTTFVFSEVKFGFGRNETVTPEWVKYNLSHISKKLIFCQSNTKIEIKKVLRKRN